MTEPTKEQVAEWVRDFWGINGSEVTVYPLYRHIAAKAARYAREQAFDEMEKVCVFIADRGGTAAECANSAWALKEKK